MDGVDPQIVDQVEAAIVDHPAVASVERLRLRWLGHQLQGDVRLSLSLPADSRRVKQEVRHAVSHAAPKLTDLTIELDG